MKAKKYYIFGLRGPDGTLLAVGHTYILKTSLSTARRDARKSASKSPLMVAIRIMGPENLQIEALDTFDIDQKDEMLAKKEEYKAALKKNQIAKKVVPPLEKSAIEKKPRKGGIQAIKLDPFGIPIDLRSENGVLEALAHDLQVTDRLFMKLEIAREFLDDVEDKLTAYEKAKRTKDLAYRHLINGKTQILNVIEQIEQKKAETK